MSVGGVEPGLPAAKACLDTALESSCLDEKGIHVQAFSPLGGQSWTGERNAVLESQVLAEIAKARGKTVAQVYIYPHKHSY